MARASSGPWYRESKGTWYATVDGRKLSLRVREKSDRKAALKAWHRLLAQDSTPKPTTNAEAQEAGLRVENLVGLFLRNARGRLKATTLAIYQRDLEEFSKSLGRLETTEVNERLVERWLLGLAVNSTTKAIRLRSVSACFGWAEKRRLIPSNPVRHVPRPRCRSRSSEAAISEADHQRLLAKASREFAVVLRVLHGTGCRPSEACRITAENFDRVNGVVVLTEHKCDATGKPRLLFLSPELVELLKLQADKFVSGALLRSKNGIGWTSRSITEAMQNLKKKVGVKTIAYGYRHGFATAALSKGIPDATVAALLGHSSTAMLHKHYSHLTSQAQVLRQAVRVVRG